MKDILAQLFNNFAQAKGLKESNYLLESGGNKQISMDCIDSDKITQFVECFFSTSIDRMKMQISGNTLKFPCKFHFIDNINKSIGSTSIDVEEVTVNTPLASRLYADYLVTKK